MVGFSILIVLFAVAVTVAFVIATGVCLSTALEDPRSYSEYWEEEDEDAIADYCCDF